MSFVVRCMLPAACRLLSGRCLLQLHVVCCLLRVSCHVVRCIFPVACCMSSGVCMAPCCTFSSGVLHVVSCVVCGIADRWVVSAARSLLPVACCLLPAPVSPVAWRALPVACPTSHLVTLHVLQCESSVACCRPHVPCCMVSLVLCLAHLACRLLPVAEWHSAVTHAAHRGGACNLGRSDRRDPLRYIRRCACVRACVRECG
jgi:hypothetical protein